MTTTPTPAPLPEQTVLPTPEPMTTAPPVIEVLLNNDPNWCVVLVQGPLTALVATLGLVVLYKWTRKNEVRDRRKDREHQLDDLDTRLAEERRQRAEDRSNELADLDAREAETKRTRAEERLLAEVAAMHETAAELTQLLMYGDQTEMGPPANRLIDQLAVLAIRERYRLPKASKWFAEAAATVSQWGRNDPDELQYLANRIKLALGNWAGNDFAESAFGEMIRPLERSKQK